MLLMIIELSIRSVVDQAAAENIVNAQIPTKINPIDQTNSNLPTFKPSNYYLLSDPLLFLRIVAYIIILFRLLEIIFFRKVKLNVKQRIKRKYLNSYCQLLKNFNEQEHANMQLTLDNTFKNATKQTKQQPQRKTCQKKKITFNIENNIYYDPILIQERKFEQIEKQIILSPVKVIEQIDKNKKKNEVKNVQNTLNLLQKVYPQLQQEQQTQLIVNILPKVQTKEKDNLESMQYNMQIKFNEETT